MPSRHGLYRVGGKIVRDNSLKGYDKDNSEWNLYSRVETNKMVSSPIYMETASSGGIEIEQLVMPCDGIAQAMVVINPGLSLTGYSFWVETRRNGKVVDYGPKVFMSISALGVVPSIVTDTMSSTGYVRKGDTIRFTEDILNGVVPGKIYVRIIPCGVPVTYMEAYGEEILAAQDSKQIGSYLGYKFTGTGGAIENITGEGVEDYFNNTNTSQIHSSPVCYALHKNLPLVQSWDKITLDIDGYMEATYFEMAEVEFAGTKTVKVKDENGNTKESWRMNVEVSHLTPHSRNYAGVFACEVKKGWTVEIDGVSLGLGFGGQFSVVVYPDYKTF